MVRICYIFSFLMVVNFFNDSANAATGPTVSGFLATPSSITLNGKDVPVVVTFKVTPGTLPVSSTSVFFSNNTGSSLSCTKVTAVGNQYSTTCTVPKTLASGSYMVDVAAYDASNNRSDGNGMVTVK